MADTLEEAPKKSPITIWATAIATILTAATGLVLGVISVYKGEPGAKQAYSITAAAIEKQQMAIDEAWKDIDKTNDRIDVIYAMLIGKLPRQPEREVVATVEDEDRAAPRPRSRLRPRSASRRPATIVAATPPAPDAGVPDITIPAALKRAQRAPRTDIKKLPAWNQVQRQAQSEN